MEYGTDFRNFGAFVCPVFCFAGFHRDGFFMDLACGSGTFLGDRSRAQVYCSSFDRDRKRTENRSDRSFAVGLLIFMIAEGCIVSRMSAEPKENLDYMIVLGAQVHGERPSRALKLRLEKATQEWERCGKPILLLSGGQGDGESITEAECMKRFLVEKGIPEDKMILEDESVSTMENLQFCARLSDCKEKKTGIVSNNFHVYRALKLAKKQGYQDVCGVAAGSDWRYQIHYMVREAFALVKEKIKGNI